MGASNLDVNISEGLRRAKKKKKSVYKVLNIFGHLETYEEKKEYFGTLLTQPLRIPSRYVFSGLLSFVLKAQLKVKHLLLLFPSKSA